MTRALHDLTEARTRLSSGLALALTRWRGQAARPPRLVVLTDARFSLGDTEQRAAARWRREGIPGFVIQLADTAPNVPRREWIDATGMSLVEVAPEAKRAVRRHEPEPLIERLAHIVHAKPRISPTPGEQVVHRSRTHARTRGASLDEQRWLTPHPPRVFLASLQTGEPGLAPRGTPLYPAEPYESAQSATSPQPDSAMPAQSVLKMLRDQLLPKARACLRRDRAGRADYAVHATFHFLLERQEILEARVEGPLERPLRDCLDAILASLRIPRFSGRVRVRYPIYTQREPQPPTIELAPETARQLDRLFDRERPTP